MSSYTPKEFSVKVFQHIKSKKREIDYRKDYIKKFLIYFLRSFSYFKVGSSTVLQSLVCGGLQPGSEPRISELGGPVDNSSIQLSCHTSKIYNTVL